MHTLYLDSEQAEMVIAAYEASEKILDARLQRADPDGIITASAALQKMKMQQLREQLKLEPVATWSGLPDVARANFITLASIIVDGKNDAERGAAFDAFARACTTSRSIQKTEHDPKKALHKARL